MVVAMRRWKVFPLVLIAPVVLGCSGGKFDYVRPTSDPRVENTKLVPKPWDVVWNKTIPVLGKQFSSSSATISPRVPAL